MTEEERVLPEKLADSIEGFVEAVVGDLIEELDSMNEAIHEAQYDIDRLEKQLEFIQRRKAALEDQIKAYEGWRR